MPQSEVKTVRRVYLRPGVAPNSMYHRALAPAPAQPNAQPGADQALITLTFIAGVAMDVPENVFDLFASIGIATKERPRRQWEQDEDAQ